MTHFLKQYRVPARSRSASLMVGFGIARGRTDNIPEKKEYKPARESFLLSFPDRETFIKKIKQTAKAGK
jgi:hypothetical protein